MCEECRQNPCASRCPNAPDPKAIYTCCYCTESIVEGDDYVAVDGDYYHEGCAYDCSFSILIDKYGATQGVACDESIN